MKATNSLILALLFTSLLSSCGKLKSERKPVEQAKLQAAELGMATQALTAQNFETACKEKGAIYNDICVFVSDTKKLGTENSESFREIPIATVPAGVAVDVSGNSYNNAVEVTLDGQKILDVPAKRPLVIGAGKLAFRLRPGSYTSVELRIISCMNRDQQPVTCPQL